MPLKFAHLCDLLDDLEKLEICDPPLLKDVKQHQHRETIDLWFRNHRRCFDDSNKERVAILSCLFPEKRADRVYWMRETQVKKLVARCSELNSDQLNMLKIENPNDDYRDLASWIARICRVRDAGQPVSKTTVADIDTALQEVAKLKRESGNPLSLTAKPTTILKPFIYWSSSRDLKWLIRIILKRLHPLWLDEKMICTCLHPLLPQILNFQANFLTAICTLEQIEKEGFDFAACANAGNGITTRLLETCLRPQIGIKVGRQKWTQCRSIKHVLEKAGQNKWSIEPKYDGEYCQIHIDLSKGRDCIQIFSKSGKDSTEDRRSVFPWLRRHLKLEEPTCGFKQSCILEGELVVYSEQKNAILEFCEIRKHVTRGGMIIGTEEDSLAHPDDHLIVIFYDILLLDNNVVMHKPYQERRDVLKKLLNRSTGDSASDLAFMHTWGTIDFSRSYPEEVGKTFEKTFARAMAMRCEGLVLKRCSSPYLPLHRGGYDGQIIKLKKDYLPGLGDSADFALIGASFDAVRATTNELKRLRWTSLVLACLCNKEEVVRYGARPLLKMVDVVDSGGISFENLQYICNVGQYRVVPEGNTDSMRTYHLSLDEYDILPDSIFSSPFLVEVIGADFDKPRSKSYYTLRFPRIQKIHDDRNEEDVISFDELQELAKEAKKIPEDILQEEQKWRDRIRKALTPKRPLYMNRDSNFSQATTESPASTRSGGQSALSNSSPCALIQGGSPQSSAAVPHATLNERSFTIKALNFIEKRTPDEHALDIVSHSVGRQKRCREEFEDSCNNNTPSKKFKIHTRESQMDTKSTKKARELECPTSLSVRKRYDPLSEISNNATTGGASCVMVGVSQTDQTNFFKGKPGGRCSSSSTISNSELIAVASDFLEHHVFALSPCVLAKEELLRNLPVEPIVTSISHWMRELQDLSASAPVVSESQAYSTLQKALLVDSQREGPTYHMIDQVQQFVTLAKDETVELWDWHVVESLASIDIAAIDTEIAHRRTHTVMKELKVVLGKWYLGCIKLDSHKGHSVWHRAESRDTETVLRRIFQRTILTS